MVKDAITIWKTQAINITTDIKGKIYLFLTESSATQIITWECHMDDSAESRYDLIIDRYLLSVLGIDLKNPTSSSQDMTKHLKGAQQLCLT